MTSPSDAAVERAGFLQSEYTHYLREHRHPWNRATHFVGIPVLIVTLVAGLLLWDWRILVGGQVVGWALQLLGHRIEGNRPALLKRPASFLMGPLLVLVELAELVGLRFGFAQQARRDVGLD